MCITSVTEYLLMRNKVVSLVVNNGVTLVSFQPQSQKPKKGTLKKYLTFFQRKNLLYLGLTADEVAK